MRTNHDTFTTREADDGTFSVIWQVKSVGSMGPDPGRVEHEEPVIEGVSREYATMLERELTKDNFAGCWSGEKNIFTAGFTVRRMIGMFAEDNPTFAESIANPLVY